MRAMAGRAPGGSVLPAVRADMRERFVVTMRVPSGAMARVLPARLRPQLVAGHAIATFCVLDLRNITVAPLPTVAGWQSRSCAERLGVLDEAGPAVFVDERLTSSRVGSAFTHLGFSAPHRLVDLEVAKDARRARITAASASTSLFEASLHRGGDLGGSVFDDVAAFAAFLAAGVRSYGPSRRRGRLTVVDLAKADSTYEPLRVESLAGGFADRWAAVGGGEIDSAFRTVDADYEWRYHGLVAAAEPASRRQAALSGF